jgi:hypothetical protein
MSLTVRHRLATSNTPRLQHLLRELHWRMPMVGSEIIDEYLIRSGVEYNALDDGMWVVHDEDDQLDNIILTWSPPILVFRVKLMNAPSDLGQRAALFEELLRLNASDMISGAYALEGNAIVATETLQAENLDFNEFQAGIDGLTLSLTQHYPQLRTYHTAS